jgi:hypothetical protein
MKSSVKNILARCFCMFAIAGTTAFAQSSSQQANQIAAQLGAIQLGIADIAAATPQQQANALAQGRLALSVTKSTYGKTAFVAGANAPDPQSQAFRNQLQQATVAALENPLNISISGSATLTNGKSINVRGSLDPTKTSASQIFNFTALRLPNVSPGLVIDAISSASNFGAPGSASADINKLAELAMLRALRTYRNGTQQWGSISTTAPSLPNFRTSTINGVAPSLNGLMDAAAATAANAINALAPALKSDPDVVAGMTASLVKAAAKFQKTSQTVIGGNVVRFSGSTGATATALIAQVAGNAQGDWTNVTTGNLLNAVVSGAMTAARNQVIAVAYGAAAGFAGTFVATGGSLASFDINAVAADILASFKQTTAVRSRNEANVNAAILAGLNVGLNQANWADPVNGVAGIGGIKDFTVVNGSGVPLTDTVGL